MKGKKQYRTKVSVVIPMYNCEQFVHDLLKMFSEQSFTDFEVICVIDGATDRTEEFVKEYCEKDRRFSYIYKQNSGAGASRNAGLDIARGSHVVFSDADDVYFENYLEKLYETATEFDAQVVVSRYINSNYLNNNKYICGFATNCFYENIVYSHCGINDLFRTFEPKVTNCIYNAEFIRENGLRFPETRISEDVFFGYASLSIADKIMVLYDAVMEYRPFMNRDLHTRNRTIYMADAVNVMRLLYQWLKKHSLLNVHGDDYFRWVNDSLVKYSEGKVTPAFISELAHMLNAEEPWDRMTPGEILSYLKKVMFANDAVEKEAELKKLITSRKFESDVKLLADYNNCKNRIHMADLLRQVCKERYGRDFGQDRNFSVTSQSNFDHFVIDSNEYKVAVSVIIPMYDCEGFVTELLMILKNQSFERFEVICVIDGATDQTEKLVAEFCKTDDRFRYVVQENLGAGTARNAGLELAKGEYIIWIDADDLYSTELIEELYTAVKHTGADMAMCLAEIKDYRTGIEKEKHGFDTDVFPDGEPVKPKDLKVLRRAIDVGIQYKMFKKAFIDKNRLFFSCTHISNDWFFDHAGRISANSIVAVHKKLVTYRKHINRSSITSKRELYLEDSVRVMRELWHWLKSKGYLPEYKDYFISAVDGGMSYNIRFNKNNNRFIKEIAKTINEDEPWKNMDTEILSKALKLSVFGENRFIKMYEDGIRNASLYNDEKSYAEQSRQELAEYAFALSTIRSVREMSAEQYGHILKPLPKVSVILPVYNVEKYIGDCIRSLKKQTLKEMEFIFIDDGSTDGSMSVIESFTKEDNRVRVYSNGKNKGAGAARNHGIDISFGEYLAFMDPDDYVEDDFYERLYRKATEGDGHDIAKGCRKEVSVHGVETGSDPGKLNKWIKSRLNEKKPLYTVFSYEHQTALFRHSLFDDRDARYGNTKKAEDVFFLFVICNKTNDIVFDEASVYYYVQRDGSLLSELSVEKHLSGLESLKDTINWIKSKRKINQYDHKYFADKLYARYKSYKSDMEKSPVLKDGYDSFLKELLMIINLTEAPQAVLDSNTKLKGVFEAYDQL